MLRDTTDYQFATPSRRLLVRQATGGVNLAEAARRHADQLRIVLAATAVQISTPTDTPSGATTITVSATLPPDTNAADRTPRSVRTAFLQFPTGLLVEVTFQTPATDDAAAAEFQRLVDSVRLAPAAPIEGVARSLAAAPTGHAQYPAGTVQLDLTADYRTPTTFLLSSTDGRQRYCLEKAVLERTHGVEATGTLLAADIGVASAEDGRPIRYEAGVRPRLSPGRRGAAQAFAAPLDTLRGGGAETLGPGQVVVGGTVRGIPVRLRVAATSEAGSPDELGKQLLRQLNQ